MKQDTKILMMQLINNRLNILTRLSDVYPDIDVVNSEKTALLKAKQELMNQPWEHECRQNQNSGRCDCDKH